MKTPLLEKIETLFWQNSFAEVSMDEVAKRLDMKKASLYYHFASKEVMFIEVLEYSFLKYKTYLEELLQTAPIDKILM
jgi:AcrR family transcriptional regulator